jgi:predicted transcriptional regulator
MTEQIQKPDMIALTADIVVAYVSKNQIEAVEIPNVIRNIHAALAKSVNGSHETVPAEKTPAVPIKKSVTNDYIVCLEDGRKLTSLKRHLRTAYGMTPEEYRAKWGLPDSYPMVAPGYSAKRSALARASGLGRKPILTDSGAKGRRATAKRSAKG